VEDYLTYKISWYLLRWNAFDENASKPHKWHVPACYEWAECRKHWVTSLFLPL